MTNSKSQKIKTPFVSIADAAMITGLSQCYIRKGVRAGTIEHITCGSNYKVNLPRLLDQLGVPYDPIKL